MVLYHVEAFVLDLPACAWASRNLGHVVRRHGQAVYEGANVSRFSSGINDGVLEPVNFESVLPPYGRRPVRSAAQDPRCRGNELLHRHKNIYKDEMPIFLQAKFLFLIALNWWRRRESNAFSTG
jgi:hypothetical protein